MTGNYPDTDPCRFGSGTGLRFKRSFPSRPSGTRRRAAWIVASRSVTKDAPWGTWSPTGTTSSTVMTDPNIMMHNY